MGMPNVVIGAEARPAIRPAPRRLLRRTPARWPGNVAHGAPQAADVPDVPGWVNGDASRAPALIGLSVGAALSLNLSLLLLRLATA